MGKYGNKTVVFNGERFDSKREEKRWKDLLLLQEAGVIRDLKRQVKFELVPTQYLHNFFSALVTSGRASVPLLLKCRNLQG